MLAASMGGGRGSQPWSTNMKAGDASGTLDNLLDQEVAAVRDAPIQGHGGEIRAAGTFTLGPLGSSWKQLQADRVQSAEDGVVGADSSNIDLIVALFRAELHQLKQAMEIVCGKAGAGDAGDFADAVGKFNAAAGGQDGAAVRNEELQKCRD